MDSHTAFAVRMALCACSFGMGAFAQPEVIPLDTGWALQSSAKIAADGKALSQEHVDTEGWYPTSVPKTVLAALVDNGVYPDPYYGMNLKSIPGYKPGMWHVMAPDSPFRDTWWYRKEFSVPDTLAGRHFTLHFDGINYKANIWLNGELIAGADTVIGMFRRFEFPITEHLRFDANNVLAVEIIPPGLIPDKKYRTKQLEATTGWDDHNPQPPDMNMGLWEDVFIRVQGSVSMRHAYVETDLDLPSLHLARLTVSAYLRNNTAESVTGTLVGNIEDRAFSQEVTLTPGETREVFFKPGQFEQLNVKNPRVWWPNPVGPQELYDLSLTFTVAGELSDSRQVRFGIREIDTLINEDDWRAYRVNGQRILIRGGAWMTNEMLLNLSNRRYEALVRYAHEANLNMLRSEGFSIRETDEFYDFCDTYGVMVTQQLFGRSIPDEDLAIACIDDTFLRIRNHPSLAHFLGHDETFPTETLDQAYRDLIERYRVRRTYQPHSGAFDIAKRDKTGGTRTGTRELWTYASPSHYYQAERVEDVAWGFAQSGGIGGILAAQDSLRQMMPADQWWPALDTEAWSFHTVTQGGSYFDAVRKAMEASYSAPDDLDEFCKKAYAMNYSSARGMYEAYGRNKYEATGITTWKYDAAWPAAMTWAYVDWYLRATAAYYGAKKACEGLHVQYAYDDDAIYVVNAFYEPFEDLEVTATLYNFDLSQVYTNQARVKVGPDAVAKAFAIEWPQGLSSTHFLKLELKDTSGTLRSQNFYWLSTTPDIPGTDGYTKDRLFFTKPKSRADYTALNTLPPVKLDVTSRSETKGDEQLVTVQVKNPSAALAFQVQLALVKEEGGFELGPVYWEDNYFSLLPGESRTIEAVVPAAELGGAEPKVRVEGWNVE